jgi:hypothetical protein
MPEPTLLEPEPTMSDPSVYEAPMSEPTHV